MRKIDFTPKFKKEMSNIEIEGIERIVETYHHNNGELEAHFGNFGFAYTSSSSYAMYNVTNEVYYHADDFEEPLTVNHFAITENDMLIMACEDEEENDHYFEIEPSDFY